MEQNYSNNRFQGMISFMRRIRVPYRIIFIVVGIISTVWFLIRVIPKPSRAAYPCMKAAAPFASSFLTYLIGITGFTLFFRKARERYLRSKYLMSLVFIILGLAAGIVAITNNQTQIWAMTLAEHQTGNEPMGVAKGTIPGRVVWVHNPDVTNENCSNTWGDYWSSNDNTDLTIVQSMLSDGIRKLTGAASDVAAWDSIFIYFNREKGNGDVGYAAGEKIVIKTNNNAVGNGPSNINTSPQICYAILNQLINVVGVAGADISIGDPNCTMDDNTYGLLVGEFPDVTYWRANGASVPAKTSSNVIFGSDGSFSDPLPQAYINAKYMINIPVFKKHHRAGISLCSKNHFGSIAPYTSGAWHLHPSLPIPDANADDAGIDDLPTLQYGQYRCFVDIMGHKDLGGKTILFLVDGLWSSVNWGHPPVKWRMEPFNNDWPSSLFMSQDPVAIESVCYDFLFEEFDEAHPTEGIDVLGEDKGPFSRFPAADDFLHQAADPANWPASINYDPENDGSILTSMGVHEHWNNAIDKKYTRNLGTGDGIELVKLSSVIESDIINTGNSELPSNQVNSIYVDSSMTVWIGTDAGLSSMNSEGWKHFDTILFSQIVNDIVYERTQYGKELWIATDSGLTVASYNDIDGITSATTYVPANSGLVGSKIAAVAVDERHNRWVGTDSAICVYRGSNWASEQDAEDAQDNAPFKYVDYPITDIDIYEDTLALITTDGQGITRLSYDDIDGFTGASTWGLQWSQIASNHVTAIDVQGEGQWYGTIEGASSHSSNLTKEDWVNYNTTNGLVADSINSVVIDDEANAWLGTDAGISIVLPDGGVFNYTETDGLVNNTVNYLTTDIEGNIWAATSGGIQWFSGIIGNQVALGKPTLVSPANNVEDQETTLMLSWTSVIGASSYHVQVATDFGFSSLVVDQTGQINTAFTVSDLESETNYFWRIAANNATLTGDWSSKFLFKTRFIEGINRINEPISLNIYPVPFDNWLVIENPDLDFKARVTIYSLDGKIQLQQGMDKNSITISTSNLNRGVYILRYSDENHEYSVRIVK